MIRKFHIHNGIQTLNKEGPANKMKWDHCPQQPWGTQQLRKSAATNQSELNMSVADCYYVRTMVNG